MVFSSQVTKLGSIFHCTCIFNVPTALEHCKNQETHSWLSAWERHRNWHFSGWRWGEGCKSARRALRYSFGVRQQCWWKEVNTTGEDGFQLRSRVAAAPASEPGPPGCATRPPWTEPTARPCSCSSSCSQAAPIPWARRPSPTRQELLCLVWEFCIFLTRQ